MKGFKKLLASALASLLGLAGFAGCANNVSYEQDMRDLTPQKFTQMSLSGTDVLGRTFKPVDAENEELYVGMFYFLWLAQSNGMTGIYDVNKITEGGKNMDAFYYHNTPESPVDKYHFWGEPMWGYYQSDDEWVIRKQVEMLTMAGIDYLYFDTTNGELYDRVTDKLFAVLQEYYDQGWDVPKVMYYIAVNDKGCIKSVYDRIYSKGLYRDLWFAPDGKPMITVMGSTVWDESDPTEQAISEFFDFRLRQWPTEGFLRDGWPWIEFEYPQPLHTDVVNVSTSQHTSVKMSELDVNRGKGFDLAQMKNDPEKAASGPNYQSQWERVFSGEHHEKIRFVNVTGWNEWVALKLSDATNKYFMVDQFNAEYSRDIEPMKGGYGDNYYMQTIQNIRKWKYTEGKRYGAAEKTVDITSFDEAAWKDAKTYLDFTGECIERNHAAFDGSFDYIDTTNRNDIASVRVLHDQKYLYFRVETLNDITEYTNGDPGWMNIYVRSEKGGNDAFMGYQYLINRTVNGNETSVCRYTKDGWQEVSKGEISVSGNVMQVRVKLSDLKMSAKNYSMQFKVTDNIKKASDPSSFYTTGDSAPIGRLSYTY